jgi:viroplasmin and RNaseH domain-containing protein
MWLIMELTLQDDNIRNQLRTAIIHGEKIQDTLAQIGISENTYYVNYWRNTKGLRDFIIQAENERLKRIARKNIDDIVSMDTNDKDDIRYLKIKADMSAFVAETLDKENFSKKTDDNADQRTPINIQVNTYKKIQALKKALPKPKEG